MDIKKNILLTLVFFCFVQMNSTFSQIKAVNDKGEKILVYPDGSWKYDREGEEPEKEVKAEKPDKKKSAKTPKKIYTREEMLKARQDVTNRYKVIRKEKETAQKKIGKLSFETASYMQDKEEEKELGLFPKNDADQANYDARVRFMKRELSEAKKQAKVASKKEKEYQKILTYTAEKLMPAYVKMISKESNNSSVASDNDSSKKSWNPLKKQPLDPAAVAKADYEKQLAEVRKKSETKLVEELTQAKLRSDNLDKYQTQRIFPVSSEKCEIAFDELDKLTGKRKRGTKTRQLFSFVDEGYESAMKGKGYLVCEGFISEVNNGKETLLVLDYIVQSTTGRDEYGGFNKGGALVVSLIDGSFVTLENTITNNGTVNVGKSTTTFRGYYLLSKSNMKMLMASETTSIKVVWFGGFEDYEVYEMDFFRDKLSCLKGTK
jgi:hypothetical protein